MSPIADEFTVRFYEGTILKLGRLLCEAPLDAYVHESEGRQRLYLQHAVDHVLIAPVTARVGTAALCLHGDEVMRTSSHQFLVDPDLREGMPVAIRSIDDLPVLYLGE